MCVGDDNHCGGRERGSWQVRQPNVATPTTPTARLATTNRPKQIAHWTTPLPQSATLERQLTAGARTYTADELTEVSRTHTREQAGHKGQPYSHVQATDEAPPRKNAKRSGTARTH